MIKKVSLIAFLLLITMNFTLLADAVWQGTVSDDFWNTDNWTSDDLAGTLVVGATSGYNPVHRYSSSTRPGRLNTDAGANLVISGGELYAWNSDYLNGYLEVGVGAVLNIRSSVILGKNDDCYLRIDSGSFGNKDGYSCYLGYGSGHCTLDVWCGTVYFGRQPSIVSADIIIGETGSLHSPGNSLTFFNDLVSNGTIRTYSGLALKVKYDSAANSTSVYAERIIGSHFPSPWDDSQQRNVSALSWTPGTIANGSRVYFGTDKNDVENAYNATSSNYLGLTAGSTKSLPYALEKGTTYYWRVDAVGTTETIKGDVWSFEMVDQIEPRIMEKIDRGLVAVRAASTRAFVSWRLFATDPEDIAFDIYRQYGTNTPVKMNKAPITDSTNFLDPQVSFNNDVTYYVYPLHNGIAQEPEEYTIAAGTAIGQFLTIPVTPVDGDTNLSYILNDAGTGDLDGDGEYEFVVKRISPDAGEDPVLDAYELDGTLLWRIYLGPNFISDVETNFCIYDFDLDGYAEVAIRAQEETIFGDGEQIGDYDGDGRTDYSEYGGGGYMTKGPDLLAIVDGRSGVKLAMEPWISRDPVGIWGDTYGHRANKPLMAAVYLDGHKPSLVISRGIYALTKLEAWNYRDGKLSKIWHFTSEDYPGFGYQGNHNLTTGDVDDDGFDEIVYGGMVVDHDGRGLWTSNMGHGDAIHLSDMDPERPGLEVWRCIEGSGSGIDLRDAATGERIFEYYNTADVGRAMAADIDPLHPGYEMWGSTGCPLYDCKGNNIGTAPGSMNFRIFWDGDLLHELLSHAGEYGFWYGQIQKWDWQNHTLSSILDAEGTYSNNWTKGTPCLQADILGDWREEVLWRSADNQSLRLYTTTDITEHRIYTLMQDPQYRQAVAWQINDYNQPPHPGFFIGDGMAKAPRPYIQILGEQSTFAQLAVSPSAVVIEPGETVAFEVLVTGINGTELDEPLELKWSVNGGGVIDPDSGQFWASQAPGTYLVSVETPYGDCASAEVTVDVPVASAKAISPLPLDGAGSRSVNSGLSWTGNDLAIAYDVYMFNDRYCVEQAGHSSAAYLGRYDVTDGIYPDLELNKQYYWRVDIVTDSGIAYGDIWSFDTMMAFDPVAWWNFGNNSDLISPIANISLLNNISITNYYNSSVIDSDMFYMTESSSGGFGNIYPVPEKFTDTARGSLTMFARVYFPSFSGVDDIWRVGKGSCSGTGLGFGGQDMYALEFSNRYARFVVSADGQIDGSESETIATHSSYLSTYKWYDITGVFTADPDTTNPAAQGSLTVYVYDPVTGSQVGTKKTIAVNFDSLETGFAGDIDNNILFFESPCNVNGTNSYARMETAALWNRALSDEEVACLSRPRSAEYSPEFVSSEITLSDGITGIDYSDAIAAELAGVNPSTQGSYSILAGPDWLSVDTSGGIIGLPDLSSVGGNSAVIRYVDSDGKSDITTVMFDIFKQRNGSDGLLDFAVLAGYWLESDCGACGGTDVYRDGSIDGYDFQIMAENWLN